MVRKIWTFTEQRGSQENTSVRSAESDYESSALRSFLISWLKILYRLPAMTFVIFVCFVLGVIKLMSLAIAKLWQFIITAWRLKNY